jgi:hypothetical protein
MTAVGIIIASGCFYSTTGHVLMRNRRHYLIIILVLIGLGLPTRMDILPLSQPLLKYGGGFLWAAMIFFIIGFIWARGKTRDVWLLALVIACGTEFSQLYQAEWLDAFRATIWGRLTIGRGFLWGDLVSYIAGISIAALIEWRWLLHYAIPDESDAQPAN